MRGNAKGPKSQLFFQVYWTVYNEPTWEPWSKVRTTLKLHEFLRSQTNKTVQNLVPKTFIETTNHMFSDSEAEKEFDDDDDF